MASAERNKDYNADTERTAPFFSKCSTYAAVRAAVMYSGHG